MTMIRRRTYGDIDKKERKKDQDDARRLYIRTRSKFDIKGGLPASTRPSTSPMVGGVSLNAATNSLKAKETAPATPRKRKKKKRKKNASKAAEEEKRRGAGKGAGEGIGAKAEKEAELLAWDDSRGISSVEAPVEEDAADLSPKVETPFDDNFDEKVSDSSLRDLNFTPTLVSASAKDRSSSPRCDLCNRSFHSTEKLKDHFVSRRHKIQATSATLATATAKAKAKSKTTKADRSAVIAAYKKVVTIEYPEAHIRFLKNHYELTTFIDDFLSKWDASLRGAPVDASEQTFVGFDTEGVISMPAKRHAVTLMQICLGPQLVVVIPIQSIVDECDGIFPYSLLELLRRFTLVGVKIREDIEHLAETFELDLKYLSPPTSPSRGGGCWSSETFAVRFVELDEFGKRVLGPRSNTKSETWGLRTLFEQLDPGYTISKGSWLRRSDWSSNLSREQLVYAATDAAASLFVFDSLVCLRNHVKLSKDFVSHIQWENTVHFLDQLVEYFFFD